MKFYSMSSLSLFSVVEAAGFPAKMKFRHMEFVLILNSFVWLQKVSVAPKCVLLFLPAGQSI